MPLNILPHLVQDMKAAAPSLLPLGASAGAGASTDYNDWNVDDDPKAPEQSTAARVFDLIAPSASGGPKIDISAATAAAIDKIGNPDAENDRLGAFEDMLGLIGSVPQNTKLGQTLSNKAVGVLYNGIAHPPDAFLGPEYAYRHADGGLNNIYEIDLGRGGTPYARSVQAKRCIHPSTLPDPGLVFDTLLKARDRVDHKGGNSALTFAFATLVTHSLFKTNIVNPWINDASSYLDLSPLYGNDQKTVDSVRLPATHERAGRGLLWPDTFADAELAFLPPAASALLVMFNRNHNYVAEMLLKLNERKRWATPPPADAAARKLQDDELFETARLVNCGHFISMIMNDYVAGFLGLSEGNAWSMNAFDPIKFSDGQEVSRGVGNHCSVEFNLLYRWHTTISKVDEEWTQELFANAGSFKGQSMEKIDLKTFLPLLKQEFGNLSKKNPQERTFAGLKRGADGRFDTDKIAAILQDATESPAGQYRARGTPGVLRPIEMLGMMQARIWGVCTMNEFRKWLGLKQFASFEEWNPDKEIAETARRLYGHIDNLELYTGLQCEQYMPLSSGLRFSCGYTMTRAVLSDAIALIRGDRFYTTYYSPATLTTWGYQDASHRTDNGGFGGHLPKLLMRHFPRNYPFNSVYGVFPFFTPQKMKDSLTRQGINSKYTFTRPVPAPIPKFIDNFTAINFVFNDPERFVSGYNLSGLGDGYGFMIAMDQRKQHDTDKALAVKATIGTKELMDGYVKWYRDTTIKEVNTQSWKAGNSKVYINIVEVIKTVHTYWAADMMCGIPLKTAENPGGKYTVPEVFEMFADLFTASFLSYGDVERLWHLLSRAQTASIAIQGMAKESILRVAPSAEGGKGILAAWVQSLKDYIWSPKDKPWFAFLSRLASTGRPVNELVAMVVGLATGSSVNQAHAAINVVDFYLDESQKENYKVIQELIRRNDEPSNKLLQGYVREAMRLNPQFTGLWRVSRVSANIPGTNISVQPGDHIWGGFKKAHLNPTDFPNPQKVDPTRDPSKYQLNGGGFHQCIGVLFAVQVIADTLKIVYSLKNVQRAPGDSGRLVGTTKIFNQVETNQYVKPDGTLTDWPVSMVLAYDE